MIISNQTYSYSNLDFKKNSRIGFTSNPNSKLLKFNSEDFFINIQGYGRNLNWANEVKKLTNHAVYNIRTDKTSDEVLAKIAKDMQSANRLCSEEAKKKHTGILRTDRKGFHTGNWAYRDIVTSYKPNPLGQFPQYTTYEAQFDKVFAKPLKKPYNDIGFTTITHTPKDKLMLHGSAYCINASLNKVGEEYTNLKRNYILNPKNVTNDKLNDINSQVGEIRWLMAHATPWERGSDAISNSFMRALYKAMGIKTYPSKAGISFDLQAYCTELADYKKNFSSYFEKPPEIID